MRILLIRPAEDSQSFAGQLAARGVESVITPMMQVAFHAGPSPDLGDCQALLFTSANGVRAFLHRVPDRASAVDLPVFAVGDASARAAAEAGLGAVESAGGDVHDLARLVIARCSPDRGRLLHVAGTTVAGDLAGELARAGFVCTREVLYTAVLADGLPAETARALERGSVDGVALFSPRTAEAFERCVVDAGLEAALAGVSAYALSRNVGGVLSRNRWRTIKIAPAATADDLLEVVLADAPKG